MPSSPDASRTQHIPRLDVVRALAFLAVYTFHFTGHFSNSRVPWNGFFRDYSIWPREFLFLLPIAFGWLGVTLFFVLSGFCIHYSTLCRKAAFTTGDFYWRRFLRIYPAYFACLVAVTALAPWLPNKYFNFGQVIAHVFMIHNFFKATFFGLNGSLWSLAVEMQFYLAYPLLLWLVQRKFGLGRCLVLALVCNVVCQVYFSLTGEDYQFSPVRTTWSFPLVTWCDWILGACLADAYVKGHRVFRHEGFWLVFSAIMLVLALQFKTLNAQSYLFGSVFFAVVMQIYLANRSPLHWFERLLIPVGLASYSLYLWHEPIVLLVNRWALNHDLTSNTLHHALFDVLVSTAILVPIATFSYHFLEVAAPAAIRRFAAKRKPAPAAPSVV